jgi:hypothetical protein
VTCFLNLCGLGSAGDELLDLQRLALGRVASQGDGFLRAVGDAHPAAHAGGGIDAGEAIVYRDRGELAIVGARTASSAQVGVHLSDIARRGEHRRAVPVGVHRPAALRLRSGQAAGATVADGAETTEHGILVQVDTFSGREIAWFEKIPSSKLPENGFLVAASILSKVQFSTGDFEDRKWKFFTCA